VKISKLFNHYFGSYDQLLTKSILLKTRFPFTVFS